MQPVPLDTDKVKKAAAQQGIDSVSELARRTGLDRAHLSRVLAGKRPAKPSHVIALARALGCQPDELMLEGVGA